jgi:predicted ArsR family transcriptional regulator
LNLECENPVPKLAFKCNLHRYTAAENLASQRAALGELAQRLAAHVGAADQHLTALAEEEAAAVAAAANAAASAGRNAASLAATLEAQASARRDAALASGLAAARYALATTASVRLYKSNPVDP